MKRLLLLLVFWLYGIILFAQDTISLKTTRVIKTYPLIILDRIEYNLAYEQTFGKRYSMEIIGSYITVEGSSSNEGGFLINTIGCDHCPQMIYANGFSLKYSVKRFFKNHNSPLGFYNSFLVMYKNVPNMKDIIDYSYDYSHYNKDRDRKVFALQYLFGWQHKIFSNHLLLGIYTGLGVRKIIDFDKINYFSFSTSPGYWETIYYDNNYEKHIYVYPTMHLGFNIGYVF